jgi:hypothetical protein
VGIDLEGLILAGRQSMHRQEKAPWAFHDFWLRDMDFADGAEASLCRAPKAFESCGHVFFPGCQIGAGDPLLVEKSYALLLKKKPDTGILLRCCGAPAEWAGDEARHEAIIGELRGAWERLGRPVMILACPSCLLEFRHFLPEVPVRSLYEIWLEWGIGGHAAPSPGPYAVFDPCAARHDAGLRAAVRGLAAGAGCVLEALKEQERVARCCGYGGQPAVASPEFAEFVAGKRASESDLPYIAYCVNCRDAFLKAGKESAHILEILLGEDRAGRRLATVTERRRNRTSLKRRLLKAHWGEEMEEREEGGAFRLHIGEDLRARMDADRILEDEALGAVEFCQRSGRRVYNAKRDSFSGYRKIGHMSLWVEYRPRGEGEIELLSAYTHRMEIELEAVWNGVRTSVDL